MGITLDRINEEINDPYLLQEGYIMRDGFVFTVGQTNPTVFNRLLIRIPQRACSNDWTRGYSSRTLEEHIALINELQLNSVKLICADISFLLNCPSVNDISVSPSFDAASDFSYDILCQLPQIKALSCRTQYGEQNQYRTTINYSRFPALETLEMVGSGHIGFAKVPSLKKLWISGNKEIRDFHDVSCSQALEDVTFLQCGIRSLQGIERYPKIKSVTCYHNRALQDISALKHAAASLESLTIEASPKIGDFSAFSSLYKLRFLCLSGSNILPTAAFLKDMPHLLLFNCDMQIADGDLSNCLSVAYATCKNYRHYNLKDKDLPKELWRIHEYLRASN